MHRMGNLDSCVKINRKPLTSISWESGYNFFLSWSDSWKAAWNVVERWFFKRWGALTNSEAEHLQSRTSVLIHQGISVPLNRERKYFTPPRSTFTWDKLDVNPTVILRLGIPSSAVCFEFKMVLISLRSGTQAFWLCCMAGAGLAEGLAGADGWCLVLLWWGR